MRRFTKGLGGFFLLALSIVGAHAQTPPTPPTVSVIVGSATLAVSTTSARVVLPSAVAPAPVATVMNTGATMAYVLFGNASVVATTASPAIPIPPASAIAIWTKAANPYLAAITASSTTSLVIIQATGPVPVYGTP